MRQLQNVYTIWSQSFSDSSKFVNLERPLQKLCCTYTMRYVIMPSISVGKGHYKMMGGVCLSVCPFVACLDLFSRTERPRKPKIDRIEANHTTREHTYSLEVKRSRSPGRLLLSQTMHHTQLQYTPLFSISDVKFREIFLP